jgi:hypothetical protein
VLFFEDVTSLKRANVRIKERCWFIMEVPTKVPGDYRWNILRLETVFQRVRYIVRVYTQWAVSIVDKTVSLGSGAVGSCVHKANEDVILKN